MACLAKLSRLGLFGLAWVLAGCQTPDEERGPEKTVAQYVKVESSVPGVTIETNGVYAGKTPLTLRIFGDSVGTFHSFGAPEYVLRALPLSTNQFLQTKVFRAGRSGAGDLIPGLVFFDMSKPEGAMQIDSFPQK